VICAQANFCFRVPVDDALIRHQFVRKANMLSRKSQNAKRRTSHAFKFEKLENRQLFAFEVVSTAAAFEISPEEQLMVELINRARANPLEEARRLGIDLNQGLNANSISSVAKQPLAPNASLNRAAAAHSSDMLERNYFDHISPEEVDPSARARSAGYGGGAAENIALHPHNALSPVEVVARSHDLLFTSSGHRRNLLNEVPSEIGIGIREGLYTYSGTGDFVTSLTTQMFGSAATSRMITGVAFTDAVIDDDFYTVGEQLSGITVEATNENGDRYSIQTGRSGGYNLAVPTGTYVVKAIDPVTQKVADLGVVRVGSVNVKLDIQSDLFRKETLIAEPPVTQEPVTQEPVTQEPVTQEPVTQEPVTQEPVTQEPVTQEPTDEIVEVANPDDTPIIESPAEDNQGTGNTAPEPVSPPVDDDMLHAVCDTNRDGSVTPLDALIVINFIAREDQAYAPQFDTNQDSRITPADALRVINAISQAKRALSTGPSMESEQGFASRTDEASVEASVEAAVEASVSPIESANPTPSDTANNAELDRVVEQAKASLANSFNVPVTEIVTESVRSMNWPNSRLGLGGLSQAVVTPGYQIVLRYRTAVLEYRSSEDGPVLYSRFEDINDFVEDDDHFCCPWEAFDATCLEAVSDAIDAILTDTSHYTSMIE
jgi:hypothetical protein